MTNETNAERVLIENVIQDYFHGYLKAESAKVAQAFHPTTRLFSVDEEEGAKLDTTEMANWLRNLEDRQSRGDVRVADPRIESIDVTGPAAIAKVTLIFPKHRFTDYLSLLRIEGQWRIVGKIYVAQARF